MSFELIGKLVEKYDTQQISERFRKREMVVLSERNNGGYMFEDFIKFQLTQERCEMLDQFHPDDMVKVSFNIRGKKWEKNGQVSYFNNLEPWKIEDANNASAAAPNSGMAMEGAPPEFKAPEVTQEPGHLAGQDMDDDLPF